MWWPRATGLCVSGTSGSAEKAVKLFPAETGLPSTTMTGACNS